MSAPRVKLWVAGSVLISAIAFLAFTGAKGGGWVYFVDVDKFVADSQFHTQRIRLHGKVGADGFNASAGRLLANFTIHGNSASLAVSYHGSIPDMFAPGRDVVVEGRQDAAGVFQADVLMTKCASKYEPGSPHAKQNSTVRETSNPAGAVERAS